MVIVALILWMATPLSGSAAWHVVQSGETLWQIGELYGVDAAAIANANDISNLELIQVGDELWIPGIDSAEPVTTSITHTVQSGETLAGIANAYGVDVLELAALNGIESPYTIFPEQAIIVPVVGSGVDPVEAVPADYGNIDPNVPFYDEYTIKITVIDLATAYGWDPYLIVSLAWRESTWDQRALSPAGAVGVMQLMPATADWAGPALVGRETDYVYSAYDNIETGIAYLSHLRSLTGSDYLALAAYFQGLASVERDGIFPVTREYALGIIESRDLFAAGALP